MKPIETIVSLGVAALLWIPFEGMAQEVYGPPLPRMEFKEECVFLGIAKRGEALIACYFQQEEWSPKGLYVRAILVPTQEFPFETGYRGFQKVDPYRVKKGEGLHLTFEGGVSAFSLGHHTDIGDTSPIPVEFLSSEKRTDLIPDDIEKMEFKVRGVSRWTKVPKVDLARWSRSFDNARIVYGESRRTPGAREMASKGELPIPNADYSGRYVTLNGTYLFEKKTVYSPIMAVLDAGIYIEHTKPVGDGWTEVLYGESRRKGYVLSVFLVENEEEALRWEKEKGLIPIQPPLQPTVSEMGSESPAEP